MKKMTLFLIIVSLTVFIINSKLPSAEAFNLQCSGDSSRICANVTYPDGTVGTYVGDKGIVTL